MRRRVRRQTCSEGLVDLDVMLPRKHGLEVCRTLRREGAQVPIIALDWIRIREVNIRLGENYYQQGFARVIISGKPRVEPKSDLLRYRVRVVEVRRQ